MIRKNIRLLDKKLVHKHKDENVFLYHLRRSLPVTIDAYTYDQKILPKLTDEERKTISLVYFPVKSGSDTIFYALDGITGSIKKDLVAPLIEQKQYSEEDMQSLLRFYELNSDGTKYYVKKGVNAIDEIQMHKLMKKRDLQIVDQDRREIISAILESIPEVEKKDIYTANMYVDVKHSFFFEHPCDHVPAIMMIEGARQMLLACSHKYGNVPLAGMNLLLSGMDVEFKRYLELNFPIKMVACVNETKKSNQDVWIFVDLTIHFYQRNEEAASVKFLGKAISNKLFDYIRQDTFNYGYNPRFRVEADCYDEIVLRDDKENEYSGPIIDLSKNGFQVGLKHDLKKQERSQIYSFYIKFKEEGLVHGKCQFRWCELFQERNLYYTGFEITELSRTDSKNLDSAIKKYCFVKYDRKFIETKGGEIPIEEHDQRKNNTPRV